MLNQIIQKIPKIKKDVISMDIMMNHVNNTQLKEKWQFTYHTYEEVLKNIALYQKGTHDQTIQNYIINDYETLSQMIYEFKEDLYPIFDYNLFLLLDSFHDDELSTFQIFEKKLFEKHTEFVQIEKVFLTNAKDSFGPLFKKLIEVLQATCTVNEMKFIPFSKLETLSMKESFTKEDFLQAYQATSTSLKYVKDKNLFYQSFLKMRFMMFILLAGEKNV